MSVQPKHRYTVEEYLAAERVAEQRHEYLDGEIYAMVGGSPRHALIATNVAVALAIALRETDCRVYGGDLRVQVAPTGLYTYPDVLVTCGAEHLDPLDPHTLLDPLVIAEVLSPSSEGYDRGAKFAHYRRLESLADYLLVAQDEARVEHYRRQAGGAWLFTEASGLEASVELPAIQARLALADVYDKVVLAGEDSGHPGSPGPGDASAT